MTDFTLAIHKFSRIDDQRELLTALDSEGESSFDNDELFAHGRDFVKSAFAQEGWKSVILPHPRRISFG